MARYQRDGWVSIWIGTFSTPTDFENYIEEEYGEGQPPSAFAREHDIGFYDADFREAEFEEPARSVGVFLKGFSHSSSFIDAAEAAARESGVAAGNGIILLYDFKYDPRLALPHRARRVRFVAALPYVKGAGPAA